MDKMRTDNQFKKKIDSLLELRNLEYTGVCERKDLLDTNELMLKAMDKEMELLESMKEVEDIGVDVPGVEKIDQILNMDF